MAVAMTAPTPAMAMLSSTSSASLGPSSSNSGCSSSSSSSHRGSSTAILGFPSSPSSSQGAASARHLAAPAATLSSSSSSFRGWRVGRAHSRAARGRKASGAGRGGRPSPSLARAELAGQYEDSFADVEMRLLDFFTFKAVRVVLKEHKDAVESEQQQQQQGHDKGGAPMHGSSSSAAAAAAAASLRRQTKPGGGEGTQGDDDHEHDDEAGLPYVETRACRDADWLQDFVVKNKVRDSKLFIRSLVLERQELAERIMVTRLHLYNTWAKRYDHTSMQAAIKDQNLELLRERLMETVKFQAEDSESSGL